MHSTAFDEQLWRLFSAYLSRLFISISILQTNILNISFNIITIGAHKIHLFTKCFKLYLTCAQHYPRKIVRVVCGLSNDDIILPVVCGLSNFEEKMCGLSVASLIWHFILSIIDCERQIDDQLKSDLPEATYLYSWTLILISISQSLFILVFRFPISINILCHC